MRASPLFAFPGEIEGFEMELAVHLREPSQMEAFGGVRGHLTALYGEDALGSAFQAVDLPDSFGRVYVGDEFCAHRMVNLQLLDTFVRTAQAHARAITLLTPPLTDEGLERCAPLFDRLDEPHLEAEVVVNDWGALEYLKENHPGLAVSLGRLLNKAFKDPRLADAAGLSKLSEETADLLNRCTFDFRGFREATIRSGASRFERDLLPHGTPCWEIPEGVGTSVYFPYGYVTMGRVCWLASFKGRARRKFSLADTCPRTCSDLCLRLRDERHGLELLQEGNAIFTLYPASLLLSFLSRAAGRGVRCVYQGPAIGVP